MSNSGSLAGKAALVTGAGRGLGRGIALSLAQAGAAVALLARSGNELDQTAEQVQKLGRTALAVPADVSDPGQLTRAVERIRDELGDVAVLINNAAVVWPLGASTSIDPSQWAAAISINVVAVVRLSFLLLPEMIATRWGRIVNAYRPGTVDTAMQAWLRGQDRTGLVPSCIAGSGRRITTGI